MFTRFAFLFSIFFTTTCFAKVYPPQAYPYPFENPYKATLSFALARPDQQFLKFKKLNLHDERNSVPFYENRTELYYGEALQAGPAPLAFLIPGTGGSAEEDGLQFFAQLLYKNGFHVITISNPFSWNFSIGASRTGVVGYIPEDLKDLTRVLYTIQKKLQKQAVVVTNYNFVGYSLGATYAGFLAIQEQENPLLGISKYVLLNPAMDFAKNLETIEKFYALGDNVSEHTKNMIRGKILDIGARYIENPKAMSLTDLGASLDLSDGALKWLICDTFRSSLGQVVFTSQNISDLGILKISANSKLISEREEEAKQISFFEYMNKIVKPTLADKMPVEKMLEDNSLKHATSLLRRNKRIFVFHNQDDFLFSAGDVEWLESTFGENHTFIYPHGGHLGNAWFPVNIKDFLGVMLTP